LQSQLDIPKHGLTHSNAGKGSLRKRHRGAKRSISSGDSLTKSSSEKNAMSKGSSIERNSSSAHRKRRKTWSKSYMTGEFKKAKPPTFVG
jgi:hypothetical protein